MYQLVVFLHVFSVLLFMFLHGVSAIVLFVLARRKTRSTRAFGVARHGQPGVAVLSLFVLVTASSPRPWRLVADGWPGVSLVLFIGIAILMTSLGRRYFDRIANARIRLRVPRAQPARVAELATLLRPAHAAHVGVSSAWALSCGSCCPPF
jgi:hypothetical protein